MTNADLAGYIGLGAIFIWTAFIFYIDWWKGGTYKGPKERR